MYTRGHLLLAVPIYVLTIRYLSSKETLLSPFLFIFLFVTMVGSIFPDIDWYIARKTGHFHHRNVFTHSLIMPLLLTILYLHFSPQLSILMIYPPLLPTTPNTLMVNVLQAFVLGVSAHLLGDNIRNGNLVGVPSSYEKWWYWANGLDCVGLLYFTGFFS